MADLAKLSALDMANLSKHDGAAKATLASILGGNVLNGPTEWEVYVTTPGSNTTLAFYLGSPTDFVVNWGDGNSNTYQSSGNASHTYTNAGSYTITMSGQAWNIQFYNGTGIANVTGCGPMGGILGQASDGRMSLDGLLGGCTGITGTLPADMFDYFEADVRSAGSLFYNTNATSYPDLDADCFANCTSVTSAFDLCRGAHVAAPYIRNMPLCTDFSNAFKNSHFTSFRANSFSGCSANNKSFAYLTEGMSYLTTLDAATFDNLGGGSIASVSWAFASLAALTSNAYPFWNMSPEPTTKSYCYYNSTNIADYASIPAAYK